ncbi:MAG TPA: Fe-S cluster assembly protein SufD [Chitinophagaceae bacterium]|nr:Fe-S cluster assembly protein SufD [Chitinophagaceae bacterium]
MDTLATIQKQFDLLQQAQPVSSLHAIREQAYQAFTQMGIPTSRHEEWKYTRISGVLNREYHVAPAGMTASLDLASFRQHALPGFEEASRLVFVNGLYAPELSVIRSQGLSIQPLEDAAAGAQKDLVARHLGHSRHYLQDGINALSTALLQGAVFVQVGKGCQLDHPLHVYHITDNRAGAVLAQPRSLFYVAERSYLRVMEHFITLGEPGSFTNQVLEMVVCEGARVEHYKIQLEGPSSNLVSTTHFHQTGKSFVHTVTLTLGEGLVRNNLNLVMDAEGCEAHLYGLYFQRGEGHVDNHTVVDNARPNCFSNELYKGVLDGHATGVFNGKIFVRQDAQKTNAYQSNKNILLSETASVNTKPQLEIFADDVKCSHGCTVGRLDEEGLFYLRSRGISQETAKSLLLHAFAVDILEQVQDADLRAFIDQKIEERLEIELI